MTELRRQKKSMYLVHRNSWPRLDDLGLAHSSQYERDDWHHVSTDEEQSVVLLLSIPEPDRLLTYTYTITVAATAATAAT